jgi:hypothetical protein
MTIFTAKSAEWNGDVKQEFSHGGNAEWRYGDIVLYCCSDCWGTALAGRDWFADNSGSGGDSVFDDGGARQGYTCLSCHNVGRKDASGACNASLQSRGLERAAACI